MSLKDTVKKLLAKVVEVGNNNIVKSSTNPFFSDVDVQSGCVISNDCEIGSYTYIGTNTTITKAVIGRYCSIANNVSIGDGEHPLDRISTNGHFYDEPYSILTQKDCIIGNDVWIGTKSIIRRGVKIGNGAVIGANSFVNKDIPDFAIAVGSPAKIIKYRFSDEAIKVIAKSKWWDLSVKDARVEISKIEAGISKL